MGLSSVDHKASNTAHVWMQDLPKPPPSVTKLSLQAYTWSLHPLHEPMVCWCFSTTGQIQSPFPLSLSLSIDLSSVTFTFSLLHPLTHPPSCRPFILLTRDGSDQLSVESGGASSELGDAGICMACFVLHQCLWVGLQHPLQWKHGGQSSYHHWCFFWDWRGTDHYSLIICPFCLHFFFLLLGVVVYENGLFLEHIHHVNDFWFCGNQGIFLWWILIYIYIYHFYGFSKWWN